MSTTYFGFQDSDQEDDVGGGPVYFVGGNFAHGKYSCPGSGSQHVQELTLDGRLIANSTNIRLAIYDTSLNLIAQGTAEVALVGARGWKGHIGESTVQNADTTTPAVLTGGVDYIFAACTDYNGQALGFWRYYIDQPGTAYDFADYTAGFPASIARTNDTLCEYGMRCGVEEAGGVPIENAPETLRVLTSARWR